MATAPAMPRRLQPELLDELPAHDPRAQRSRADLRRIHHAMGTLRLLERALAAPFAQAPPRRILEVGAGDGSLMLRLARRLAPRWPGVELTLLDRLELVDARTRAGFAALGWTVQVKACDVFEAVREPAPAPWDLVCANLFLHHFEGEALRALLAGFATRTRVFCAFEPRRATLQLAASRLLGAIGANAVTRQDAVLSVRAGFRDAEIGALWPRGRWQLSEGRAGLFSHRFVAVHEREA
jgi:hypothetical protein